MSFSCSEFREVFDAEKISGDRERSDLWDLVRKHTLMQKLCPYRGIHVIDLTTSSLDSRLKNSKVSPIVEGARNPHAEGESPFEVNRSTGMGVK